MVPLRSLSPTQGKSLMTLDQYLTEKYPQLPHGKQNLIFAERIGVGRWQVKRMREYQRTASIGVIYRIKLASNGLVDVEGLLSQEAKETERKVVRSEASVMKKLGIK